MSLTVNDTVIDGNANYALDANQIASSTTVSIAVTGSVVSRNGFGGIVVASPTSSEAHVTITRNAIIRNQGDALSATGSANLHVIATGNTITNNSGTGMRQDISAVFYSSGDNVVQGNLFETSGTLTPLAKY